MSRICVLWRMVNVMVLYLLFETSLLIKLMCAASVLSEANAIFIHLGMAMISRKKQYLSLCYLRALGQRCRINDATNDAITSNDFSQSDCSPRIIDNHLSIYQSALT